MAITNLITVLGARAGLGIQDGDRSRDDGDDFGVKNGWFPESALQCEIFQLACNLILLHSVLPSPDE